MPAIRITISSTLLLGIILFLSQITSVVNAQTVSDEYVNRSESSGSRPSQQKENCVSDYSSVYKFNHGDGCLNRREMLTGDWWGVRPSLEEQGITFDGSVTQFYQGVANGGRDQLFRYGGHGEYGLSFDFGKLSEVKGLSLELGAEHRFGESINSKTGSVIPSSLLLDLPDPDTEQLALTKVLFRQEFSEHFEIFFGKMDTLEYDENVFASGNGREQFFSTPFNYNPIATKTIPFSTLGAGFNVMHDGERLFTLAVINTEDTATTSGFNELFADGAAVLTELRIPVQLFGRTGHQIIGGSWSSRTFDSLAQSGRVNFPDLPIDSKEGSWAIYWNADQFLWEDPCDASRGWGLFGRAGISDGNPNPIAWFLSFGVGGHSPLRDRENDTFGVGWYYNGISDELGPVISTLLNDGQGVELYYNIAISEWFHITPDLQIVEPNITTLDRAVVLGLRARVDF